MSNAINLKINAIQHIGVPVTNLETSQLFYSRLGFSNVMEAPFTDNGGTGTCVMMQSGNIIMELYQLPDAGLPAIRSRSNGHIDHVAFDVSDIEEAFKEITKAGFNVLEPEPVFLQFWEKGCKYFNITGPDGERLEFNQVL
ncbi:VOC family protein [Mucilaginibacter ginsenosidivorax]|uniref:VOC family protein n=1 Tax=Mucilaginibacter ginsenosidivorax TaxID=862126 RepID=A0A5B8W0R6_9SPHI|nr:VOC family protein [Mucilaginibacter ginsenosidivorax]QEC77231.1 VOC family protein [Mucilaginibacter ginsenosidivorax]